MPIQMINLRAAQLQANPEPVPAQGGVTPLHNVVIGILGPCNCLQGRACPPQWHTFRRVGVGARAFVEGATTVKLNIVKAGDHVRRLEAAAAAYGIHCMINDDRSQAFRRYNVTVNVNNPVHRAFLEYWLPRTIA